MLDDEMIESVAYYEKTGYGWFVCAIYDQQESDVPDDLRKILEYALSLHAEWVMFDCDAEVDDNLPVYDRDFLYE